MRYTLSNFQNKGRVLLKPTVQWEKEGLQESDTLHKGPEGLQLVFHQAVESSR